MNIFPTFYDGAPIPIDTTGYTKIGIVLLWNKNGGTGTHTVRLVNNVNQSEVMISGDVISGRNKNYDIDIPVEFQNFRGELLLQAKSTVATDDPIFDGLWIYLIR